MNSSEKRQSFDRDPCTGRGDGCSDTLSLEPDHPGRGSPRSSSMAEKTAAPAPKKAKNFKGVVVIKHEQCKGCGFCVEFCPLGALELEKCYNAKGYHPPFFAKPYVCNGCDMC